MKEKQLSLLTLPAEIRNMIWELLVLKDDNIVMNDGGARSKYSRPAILKVCHQIANEASPIFWGGNGLEAPHLVKHLKLWGAHGVDPLGELPRNLAGRADFDGLERLDIRMGKPYPTAGCDDCWDPSPDKHIDGNELVLLVLLRKCPKDGRLPTITRATQEDSLVRLVSDETFLRQKEEYFDLSKAIADWVTESRWFGQLNTRCAF